jgi:hypothetical protein
MDLVAKGGSALKISWSGGRFPNIGWKNGYDLAVFWRKPENK